MKNLDVILSRTVLIGLMTLVLACVDKRKEDENKVENRHDQEMHDGNMHHEEMNHGYDAEMKHDDDSQGMSDMSKMSVKESKAASSLIDDYLAIKNALVNDKKDTASKAGLRLAKSADAFVVSEVEDSKQTEAKDILYAIKTHATHISKNKITKQRTHFAEINAIMKNLLSITGSDRTLYEQYCPMYADNAGGFWLSEFKDIKNPLFGSRMLTCGSVQQTIVLQ